MLAGGDPHAIASGAGRLRQAATEVEDWLGLLTQVRRQAINGCSGASAPASEAIGRWADALGACGDDTTQHLKALGLLASSTASDLVRATGGPAGAH